MSILEVSELKKVYVTRFGGNKVEALKNVNFKVEEVEYHFDTGLSAEAQIAAGQQMCDNYSRYSFRHARCLIEGREANRADFLSSFGGLFFLGILLSIVFIIAAVLIIYYKQISEGYEDQARFDIMKKVGMTSKEIRKSINSQLLTVFYLLPVLCGDLPNYLQCLF